MSNPGRFQPGQSGNPNGRKKGAPNKITRELKEAILAAYEKAGGVAYLTKLAQEDPRTFCMLLGKVLPLQVNATINKDLSAYTDAELAALIGAGQSADGTDAEAGGEAVAPSLH